MAVNKVGFIMVGQLLPSPNGGTAPAGACGGHGRRDRAGKAPPWRKKEPDVPLVSMSRQQRIADDEGRWEGGEWLKAPQRCLAAELGSRDGRGDCELCSSIVHVGLSIPVGAARWAVESREGSGALRRCCGRSLSSGMLGVTSPPGLAGTAILATWVAGKKYGCSMLQGRVEREDASTGRWRAGRVASGGRVAAPEFCEVSTLPRARRDGLAKYSRS